MILFFPLICRNQRAQTATWRESLWECVQDTTQTNSNLLQTSTCKTRCVTAPTENIIWKVAFLPRRFMLSIASISPGPAVWLNFTSPFQKHPNLFHSYQMRSRNAKSYANQSYSAPSTSKGGNLPNAAEFFLFPPDCRLWQEPAKIITRGDMSPSLSETENVHCQCFWEIIITFQRSVLWCLPLLLFESFLSPWCQAFLFCPSGSLNRQIRKDNVGAAQSRVCRLLSKYALIIPELEFLIPTIWMGWIWIWLKQIKHYKSWHSLCDCF